MTKLQEEIADELDGMILVALKKARQCVDQGDGMSYNMYMRMAKEAQDRKSSYLFMNNKTSG
jgi:hypothetical protein